jgi:tRNA A37 methylthiotransferase MiaB
LIKKTKPDFTNISKFGKRQHARASKLKQLPNSIINERSSGLYRVVREIQNNINSELLGKKVDALITEQTESSINGRTDSYKQAVLQNNSSNLRIGDNASLHVYAVSANALYCNV